MKRLSANRFSKNIGKKTYISALKPTNLKTFLRNLGPGLLFAGAAIGVSHLVQSTRAGADFGLGLLWVIFVTHLFKYPFFQFGPRYAMATGESLLDGYRRLGKKWLYLYFALSLATMFSIQTAVTLVTAGIAINLFGISSSPALWSTLITGIATLILIKGQYRTLDRIMKFIVLALGVCTFAAVLLASGKGQWPSAVQIIPSDALSAAFLLAFMGWMPAPLDISVWQSLWALEKQKDQPEYTLKASMNDFHTGYISTIVMAVFFLVLGALIMHGQGLAFEDGAAAFAAQFMNLYTETLGEAAWWVVAIAAFTAMLSTTLTTLDASPRSMERSSFLLFPNTKRLNYSFWISVLALGTVILLWFFQTSMKSLIDIATIISFVTAPFYAILNFALVTSTHMPTAYQPSLKMRWLSWCGIVFLIGFSLWYVVVRLS